MDTATIDPVDVTLRSAGATVDFEVDYYGCKVYRDDRLFTWSSSAPDVATVDERGVVTAVSEGQAEIEAILTHVADTPRITGRVTVTFE